MQGGNKGIGLESTRLLAERFPKTIVLLGARSVANGHADANVRTLCINVATASSVEAAAEYVVSQYDRVDGLVQNAGVVRDVPFDVNLVASTLYLTPSALSSYLLLSLQHSETSRYAWTAATRTRGR